MKKSVLFAIGLSLLLFALLRLPAESTPGETWDVTHSGNELQIAYGSGTDFPQYGVLHLDDSYFRLNYGPTSEWGTSAILLPAFWSGGTYYQGAPISATHQIEEEDLVLSITGTISTPTGSLAVSSEVRLLPPVKDVAITARVTTTVTVSGSVPLDNRPGEAFKPIMLSSMHIAPTVWDTQAAYADCHFYSIPASGWIVQPPAVERIFGLVGGTSTWKSNASTIEVGLDQSLQVTGWVTSSSDPNDDNVGFWAVSAEILPSWSYTITAVPEPTIRCVSKQASPSPVQDGAPLTYTLRVTNTGTQPFTPTIRDVLPSHVTPTGVLSWTPTLTAPGGIWMHQFSVTVETGYTGSLTNKVQVTTEEGPWGMASATVCANSCLIYLPVILRNYPPTYDFEDDAQGWGKQPLDEMPQPGQGVTVVNGVACSGDSSLQFDDLGPYSSTTTQDVGVKYDAHYQVVTACVYLPARAPSIPVVIYVQDRDLVWHQGDFVNLVPGVWNMISFDLRDKNWPSPFKTVGLHFTPGSYTGRVFIDNVRLRF